MTPTGRMVGVIAPLLTEMLPRIGASVFIQATQPSISPRLIPHAFKAIDPLDIQDTECNS